MSPVASPVGATGPDDGDPSRPVVALPDIPCGPGRAGFGLGTANLKIGGRDVILTYPCGKHEGANVTFLLNLHGTNANESSKSYVHGYFAAHTLTTSHNLIVAEPKSRASQWGNTGENAAAAEDKPHLLEVIDYVYKTFGSKFNLTSTWVSGHSWGAMYAKRFVCDESVKDRVRGVIGMSGGATAVGGRGFGTSGSDLTPRANCADYVAQIHTVGEMDSVTGVPDQTAAATKHGCGPKTPARDLGSQQLVEEWPGCDPGWVHENINMGAHTHVTAINPEVVKHIVDRLKASEKR
jgi:pimeloyl-ACP methyl ester carboxylesterase